MRRLILPAALGLALLAALLIRAAGPGGSTDSGSLRRTPESASTAEDVSIARPAVTVPSRNLFRYVDRVEPRFAPSPTVTLAPSASQNLTPVRLVGFIRKAGELKAALVIEGEVFVLGPRGEAGGYTVLLIDEEAGVRLRGPSGSEIALSLPPL